MKALYKNETWDLMPRLVNVDLNTCKWVYKVKRKLDKSISRYKTRLIVREFFQKYIEDYEKIFNPIAKMTSIKITIVNLKWKP